MLPLRRLRPHLSLTLVFLSLLMFGLTVQPAAAAPGPNPVAMGDAFLIDETGGWFCPSLKATCLSGSQQFASWLLEPGYLTAEGPSPLYLRVAKARNDCEEGQENCSELGVPNPTSPCGPAATNTPFCALMSLKTAGVKLGTVLSAKTDQSDAPRNPSALAWHACQIRKADIHHLYDFMFMDYTFRLKPPDVRDAVRLIQTGKIVRSGRTEDCAAGGWPHLITNDTTWRPRGSRSYSLRTGAWAHAKRLGVIQKPGRPASAGGAFTSIDRAFVKRVNRLGSRAVLRLEVTPDTSEFAALGRKRQCSLLTSWARGQNDLGYSLIFPLFVHGATQPPGDHPYDSVVEGTLARQLELIAHPSRAPLQTGCPSPQPPGYPFGQPPPPLPPIATPTPPAPPPTPAPRAPDVASFEPSNLTCHSARLNGWVNPHGSSTSYHFEYWKRGEVNAAQPSGYGDAGAGVDRVDVARVVDGLQRDTGYTGKLMASNIAGRSVSDIFSFTTPRC